ncbi:hypothetical protein M1D97_15745 [Kushneria sp. AK178]
MTRDQRYLEAAGRLPGRVEPADMPTLVGMGDTVTPIRAQVEWQHGGSNRGFLQLIERPGEAFERESRGFLSTAAAGRRDAPASIPPLFHAATAPFPGGSFGHYRRR